MALLFRDSRVHQDHNRRRRENPVRDPSNRRYLLGTSLLQIGYQSGAALTVAGLATLFTNAVPIAAGTVVLHEQVPTGALGVIRVIAFAAVMAGANPTRPA